MNLRVAWAQQASAVGVTLAVDVGVKIFFPRHPQKGCGCISLCSPLMKQFSSRPNCRAHHEKGLHFMSSHVDCCGMYCLDKFSLPDIYTYGVLLCRNCKASEPLRNSKQSRSAIINYRLQMSIEYHRVQWSVGWFVSGRIISWIIIPVRRDLPFALTCFLQVSIGCWTRNLASDPRERRVDKQRFHAVQGRPYAHVIYVHKPHNAYIIIDHHRTYTICA